MLDRVKNLLIQGALSAEEEQRIDSALHHLNSAGYDPWGVDPRTLKTAASAARWLYRDYFRVETRGLERLPQGRMLIIANHGGQLPIDGFAITMALLFDADPPRLARAMVERWVPFVPFVSTFFSRCGQVTGDFRTCRELLEKDECVMVFPEGVAGSGKTIQNRYHLQRFGTGFVRLALETCTPIVPVGVIGAEEAYPAFHNARTLARALRIPYLPITPTFPLLGPLGAVPLPTKITLRFGKPLLFDTDPDAPDREVMDLVKKVKLAIRAELNRGLKKRGGRIFTGSGR